MMKSMWHVEIADYWKMSVNFSPCEIMVMGINL